jgi:glycosyltransferase involved in cell wall biosynthesis
VRRILVSAYACEPGRGSEGEIGWSIVHELAKTNQVWVITRANNNHVHETAFAQSGKPDTLNFIYYDTPKWARWYKKGKRFFLIYYYLWQIGSVFAGRRLVKKEQIDLVHHLTGGMDWMPSGLALLGLPFVWGPVGSEEIPRAILRTLPFKKQLKEIFRKTVQFYGRYIDPFVFLTGRRAHIILSHTPESLPGRYRHKIVPYLQTGIHPTGRFVRMRESFERGKALTVIYAGELIHWKGSAYAVDAFLAFARDKRDVRLLMIGDGPLRAELQQKAAQSGLAGQIEFRGKVPMAELIDTLRRGDVFLYPSYHHGLATVVLQAMLTGLPVICLQGDAIGRAVASEYGAAVPLNNDGTFIQGLCDALLRLYGDEELRATLGKRAQEVAIRSYSYHGIGAGYEEIYRKLVAVSHRGNISA